MSQLISNTQAFVKGEIYGNDKKKKTKRTKTGKIKLKRGQSVTMDGTVFKNIPGSFRKQLRTKSGRKK